MSPTDAPRKHVEGRPIVRRFVVKRLKPPILSDRPWKVRDRSRPAWLGHAATHAEALEIVNRKLAAEHRPSASISREGTIATLTVHSPFFPSRADYDGATA